MIAENEIGAERLQQAELLGMASAMELHITPVFPPAWVCA